MDDGEFSGRRVLVTGATSGIGFATAVLFQHVGALVAVNGVNEREVDCALGEMHSENVIGVASDLSTAEGCRKTVEHAASRMDGLDVLVNNAGVWLGGPIDTVDEAAFDAVIAVNLKAQFFCSQTAIPYLRQSGGNIVNIASESGLFGNQDCAVYCASKGGSVNFTRALACELAPSIRVNAVCPGPVMTAMATPGIVGDAARNVELERLRCSMPLGEITQPEEVAQAVLYLASDAARSVTATTLSIDGGRTGVR